MSGNKKGIPKPSAGGSATIGGISFQASVTAAAFVRLARGIRLNWLPGLVQDIPVSILAETGGPGDDIRVVLKSGGLMEAQVKRGLTAGGRLWEPMEAMAQAIASGDIAYGVLVVSSDSSNTIRTHLAHDLARIGDGRTDGLKHLAREFMERLKPLGLDPKTVCSRLRIVVNHCDDADDATVAAARAELANLVEKQSDVSNAWNQLYKDAERLMQYRGQRAASAVLDVLASAGISLRKDNQSPAALIAQLSAWVLSTNAHYTVFGLDQPLPIDGGWIALNIIKRGVDEKVPNALAEAIEFYHDWHKRATRTTGDGVAPEALGRFYLQSVVVAGPGMGKSTLLKKLARIYASENRPVLKVRLPLIAARMKHGAAFEEALFAYGLDSSSLQPKAFRDAAISNWVLLCDGLDECGQYQEQIAQSLVAYSSGHPQCSIIATTRPIGYTTTLLSSWRHYELLPLEADKEREHMGMMLRSIYPTDQSKRDGILTFALGEIQESKSSKAVARSPLLLGLTLSLAIRGVRFGKSKEQLYEKIFGIIDEIPNGRDISEPPSKAVLLRFLEILAWDNVRNPISEIEQTLSRCGHALAAELNQSFLSGKEAAEQCSLYWQTVGLLERVSHAGDETLTFIHKTFGEYAAGRYLAHADTDTQSTLIPQLLDKSGIDEILSFAGALGAVTVLTQELLKSAGGELKCATNVGRALTLVAEANPPPDQPVRQQIAVQAVICALSKHELVVHAVASPLRECAKRFPSEFGPLATDILVSPHSWSQLAGWSVKLAAGPAYYALPELEKAFATIPAKRKSSFRNSLGGGMVFGTRRDSNLLESFMLEAMRALLEAGDPTRVDALISATFKIDGLQGWGLVRRAQQLLKEHGRDYSLIDLSSVASQFATARWDPEGYKRASDIAFTKMVEPLTEALDPGKPPVRKSGRLIWLGAFFDLTDVWEMASDDVWGWRNDPLSSEAAMVIRYVGQLIDIDRSHLAADAQEMIAYIAEQKDDQFHSLFGRIAHVDAPPIDWEKASGQEFDLAAIERAIYHRSDWLMTLAARLLEGATTPSERAPIVERVLGRALNTALSIGVSLAQTLPQEVCDRLVRAAIRKDIRPGFEYLFEFLAKHASKVDNDLFKVIHSGLDGESARIAKAAAKLALSVAKPGMEELGEMLRLAYAHWQLSEEPYPSSGGVVPDSPREDIIMALLTSSVLTDDELFQMADDPRSDVQGAIKAEALGRMKESEAFRNALLARTMAGTIPNRLLIEALRDKQPLSASDVETILTMTGSASAKVRFAALGVLNAAYLEEEDISRYLLPLLQDPEEEIRSRAASIQRGEPT